MSDHKITLILVDDRLRTYMCKNRQKSSRRNMAKCSNIATTIIWTKYRFQYNIFCLSCTFTTADLHTEPLQFLKVLLDATGNLPRCPAAVHGFRYFRPT